MPGSANTRSRGLALGLPLHHALQNAGRRPLRSVLFITGSALVAALLVATSAFIRSLEASHLRAAPRNTAILISTSAMRDIVRSSMSPAVAELAAAEVPGVLRAGALAAASPEIHMATDLKLPDDPRPRSAFVRGITDRAYLVHEAVTLVAGRLPGPGEAMVGRLAGDALGVGPEALSPGRALEIEGGRFEISGVFAAPGTTIDAEIWLGLADLQSVARRDDASCVFVRVARPSDLADVELFANRRLDLELLSVDAESYYEELAAYFDPILALAWAMAVLIAVAAATGGANIAISSVEDRRRELAALRAIGYRGGSIARGVLVELVTLGMLGALIGLIAARLALRYSSVHIAMSAFRLEVDAWSVILGLAGTLAITVTASLPAIVRIARLSIVRALQAS